MTTQATDYLVTTVVTTYSEIHIQWVKREEPESVLLRERRAVRKREPKSALYVTERHTIFAFSFMYL